MDAKEVERSFLDKVGKCLLSLPFDLKILQEAVTDPDLDRAARELAAGAIVHTLGPQEGDGPLRFIDDVFFVRAALKQVLDRGGEGAQPFRARFAEDLFDQLDADLKLFEEGLGDLWPWLTAKVAHFPKIVYKGKRVPLFADDEDAALFLYEEGLEFQTNYNVNEEQVRNKLRRAEIIVDMLNRRRADEAKKIA